MATEQILPPAARPPLFAIALLAATALAYEVLLIRLFSIIQWHHFAYMIISLALLGYGASGTFLSLTQTRLLRYYAAALLANLALFGLSLTPAFLFAQTVQFNPEEMLWNWRELWRLTPVYLVLSLPFFFAANAIALTFARYRPAINRIYAIDLLGAGAGSVVIVLLLYSLPPLDTLTLLSICGVGCVAFAAFDLAPAWRVPALALTAVLIALSLWLGSTGGLAMSPYKDLSQQLRVSGAQIMEERSSPLGLINVVDNQQIPARYAPGMSIRSRVSPPRQLALFADGNSVGAITQQHATDGSLAFLDQLAASLPYHLQTIDRVLILGAGGGMDVLQAVYQGSAHIDAVELNPQIADLIGGPLADFSGDLYRQPGVRLHIAEARGFLHSGEDRYDLIVLPPQDGGGAGLYALTENYLYTVEALQSCLARLQDQGYLVLNQWLQLPPRNTLRLFATAVAALRKQGIGTPGDHLLLVRGWQTSTLLIKATPFNAAELAALREYAQARAFDLAWAPDIGAEEVNRFNRLQAAHFHDAAQRLLSADAPAFIDNYKFNILPATDDRPYFNNFFRWSSLQEIMALRDRGGVALIDAGYPVLLATLLQALLFSALLILLPLLVLRRAGRQARAAQDFTRAVVYFGAIGLAFLFIEIAFIQKFTLFLHHPVVTVSTVLASFLVFAGLGSLNSRRYWSSAPGRPHIWKPVLAIAVLGMLYVALLDEVFAWLSGWPLPARAFAGILLIAPLAFFMGMPFPLALTRIARERPAQLPFAWGVNGCASVLSAVLATLLAVHFGFTIVVMLALGLYLVAAASLPGQTAPG